MIESIRKRIITGRYRFTIHAVERCVERGISPNETKDVYYQANLLKTIQVKQ